MFNYTFLNSEQSVSNKITLLLLWFQSRSGI